MEKFQSSPGPKARSYLTTCRVPSGQTIVPILSRPEGPELLPFLNSLSWDAGVPILSRPEGPELQHRSYSDTIGPRGSNPLQARRPGATPAIYMFSVPRPSSNPLQARRPGATPSPGYPCNYYGFQSSPGPKARSYAKNLST